MLPTTVDGVIATLDHIVNASITTGSRLGYFAALYKRMTMAIRDGMRAGKFQDNARMERLDVMFANRYLVTRQQWFAGDLQGQTWLQAYNAAGSSQYSLIQQLLVCVNPHATLDLGIAAARTCPGDELAALEQDFHTVNSVILSLFPVIDAELDGLSPFDNLVDHSFLGYLKNKAINVSIDAGRQSSWEFAQSLAYLDLPAQAVAIGKRDLESMVMGDLILKDPMAAIGHKLESQDIAHNIQVLNAPAARTPQTNSPQR